MRKTSSGHADRLRATKESAGHSSGGLAGREVLCDALCDPASAGDGSRSVSTPSVPFQHYHPSLRIRGRAYDVSHLDPFQFEVCSTKVPRPLRINVRFTNHCFSEAFDPSKHPANEPPIMDGTRRRAFCPVRYELSPRLPALIRGLADPGSRVHETATRRNWMYAAVVEMPAAGTQYQIFFELRRTVPERRRQQDIDMIVESAYPADPSRPEPNILGRVNFQLLAGSLYVGKPVTTRR